MIATAATIRITPAERDDLEWAFDALASYWGADCVEGQAPSPEAEGVTENELIIPGDALMPFIDDDRLVLSTWDEINDDLAYRIGEQRPGMADNAASIGGDMSPQRAGQIAARCHALAERIREAS